MCACHAAGAEALDEGIGIDSNHPCQAQLTDQLSLFQFLQGKLPQSEANARRSLAIIQNHFPAADPAVCMCQLRLGSILFSEYFCPCHFSHCNGHLRTGLKALLSSTFQSLQVPLALGQHCLQRDYSLPLLLLCIHSESLIRIAALQVTVHQALVQSEICIWGKSAVPTSCGPTASTRHCFL